MIKKIFVLSIFILISSNCPQHKNIGGIHKEIDQLILSKQFDKAEALALDAYKNYPDKPEVLCALACVYRNKAKKSQLVINLGAMGIKEGESGSAGLDSMSLQKYINEKIIFDTVIYKKAENLYEKIIEKDPHYENAYYNMLNDYVLMASFEKYFLLIDKFIENFDDDNLKKNALLELAYKLVNNKDVNPQIAIKMYNRILQAYPDYAYAKADLATIYHLNGETLKAIPLFKNAYEQDPNDRMTLTNYVYSLVFLENFNEAYKLGIVLSELDSMNLNLTGMLGYLLDKPFVPYFDKLAQKREKAVEDPKKDFWYMNSLEYNNLEKMSKKEKLDFFQYLLENFNNADMTAEAIAAGNIVMKIEPTNFTLLTLGSIYDRFMNLDMTIKYLDLISERMKTDSTIISEYNLYTNYARIYLVNDKFEKAEEYLLKTKGMKKQDAMLNHYLGLCCIGLGRKEEAITYFKQNSAMNEKDQMEWINKSIWKLRELGIKE